MRTIWIIIPRNRVNGRVTRELFEPVCAAHYAPEEGSPRVLRFSFHSLPLVSLLPPRFSLLAFFPFDIYPTLFFRIRKGYSLNLNAFFPPGKDTGYSSPRFNDYAAFWCGSNDTDEYLIWYWMWILEGAVESGKWKFRVNTTLVDTPCKRKFLSTLFALSSRVISIPLFNIPDQSFVN